jgi:hypothetical protein
MTVSMSSAKSRRFETEICPAVWIPETLLQAFNDSGDEGSPADRECRTRMVTDSRLQDLYQRLAPAWHDRDTWRAFLDACVAAAWAANNAEKTRAARTRLDKLLRRIEHLSAELARTLERCRQAHSEAAIVPGMPEFVHLVNPAAVGGILRCEAPSMPRLLEALGLAAHETRQAEKTPVNEMLEAALRSRKFEKLRAYTWAFEFRWAERMRFSHSEMATIAVVALGFPDRFGNWTEADLAAQYREAVRDARRNRGGGRFALAKNRESPLAPTIASKT